MAQIDLNRYAQEYDLMCGFNPEYQILIERIERDLKKLNLKKNSIIGDLGSGTGNLSLKIARFDSNKYKVISVDNNEEFLKLQNQKIQNSKLKNVKILKGDVTHKNLFKPETLNVALIIHCLNLIPKNKREEVLKNVYSFIKPGGYFIIADIRENINVDSWLDKIIVPYVEKIEGEEYVKKFLKDIDYAVEFNRKVSKLQTKGKIHTPSLIKLCELLKKQGFEIYHKSDKLYNNCDNYIIAKKN